jgi:hypothetical protein
MAPITYTMWSSNNNFVISRKKISIEIAPQT